MTLVVSVSDYECAIDSKDQPVCMIHPQIDDIAERFVLFSVALKFLPSLDSGLNVTKYLGGSIICLSKHVFFKLYRKWLSSPFLTALLHSMIDLVCPVLLMGMPQVQCSNPYYIAGCKF